MNARLRQSRSPIRLDEDPCSWKVTNDVSFMDSRMITRPALSASTSLRKQATKAPNFDSASGPRGNIHISCSPRRTRSRRAFGARHRTRWWECTVKGLRLSSTGHHSRPTNVIVNEDVESLLIFRLRKDVPSSIVSYKHLLLRTTACLSFFSGSDPFRPN
nr:hypothetical protein CFP56_41484 [Quercus suber]